MGSQSGVALRERVRTLVEAGLANQQAGRLDEAQRCFDQADRLMPNDPAILGIQGMLALEQDRLLDAERLIRQAIDIRPDEPRLQNFFGLVQMRLGEEAVAERIFGRAVTLAPDFLEAWCNLAMAQLANTMTTEAILSLKHAIALGTGDPYPHQLIAKAYYYQRDLKAADESLQEARRLGAAPSVIALWQSLILRDMGQVEAADRIEAEALSALVQAPGGDKAVATLMAELGEVCTHAGNLGEAEQWLRKAVDRSPEQLDAYIQLAAVHKYAEADGALISQMLSLLPKQTDSRRQSLEFALGKVYADMKDYDQAFMHYQSANQIARARVAFDVNEYVARLDRIINTCTRQALDAMPSGDQSELPVLIIGTPRSGTTLTESIISSHSAVAGAGELSYWGRLAPSIVDRLAGKVDAALVQELTSQYLRHLRQYSATARRITDKMPQNYTYLGVIHALFPRARFIHCKRHPIDACLSIYFQNFNDRHAYRFDLEGMVVFYEQYQRLMAHWRSVLPPGVMLEVRYEELVEDPEGQSKRMMEFLGLEWEPGQMEYYKQDRSVFTCSKWQARQPIYKSSKEKWRAYEKHLGPLLALLKYAE